MPLGIPIKSKISDGMSHNGVIPKKGLICLKVHLQR